MLCSGGGHINHCSVKKWAKLIRMLARYHLLDFLHFLQKAAKHIARTANVTTKSNNTNTSTYIIDIGELSEIGFQEIFRDSLGFFGVSRECSFFN